MAKLTAIVPTGNEVDNIDAVLQCLSFADEIMVVDSYSTDATVERARQYTDFILQREYVNSASQKNWAIPQASHEWILLLDADERISHDLREEIRSILENNPEHDAYWIYRQNHFMGRKLKYSGWQGDKVIRLFKRDQCRYEEKHVHAEVMVQGTTGYLKNKLDHFTYMGLDHYLDKSYRYSTWGAYDRVDKINRITPYHLVVKPFFGFVKKYFLKLGFLDGKQGLIIALQYSTYLFVRALKIWRLHQGEKLRR